MKIITGPPARGSDFFIRDNIINKMWESIQSKSNIMLIAPRRVGKTSIMYHLRDNPKEPYNLIYLDTESVNNENEFYKKLLSKVLTSNFINTKDKLTSKIKELSPGIKKIGPDGVEFDRSKEFSYFNEFLNIIDKIDTNDQNLIILLDEFSQTVENIKNDEGEKEAIHFLQTKRSMRQEHLIDNNIRFIYSGSIGLGNIVRRINATKTINDLQPIKLQPLSYNQAVKFINKLLEKYNFTINDNPIEYILDSIEWLIPFYIQLVIQVIKDDYRLDGSLDIDEDYIENVFDRIIGQQHYFDNWHSRLKTLFKTDEYNFCKELLNTISEDGTIQINKIRNIAVKYDIKDQYKNILNSLVYDGYINNNDKQKIYRFNSPILRRWWWKYVAN
ncbi:MAG: ATP-binding protein [Candidatus Marinimicrobia bacterium]|nr:ATP-binding protein [Candidatus Neomarinimicrobiota bacterium]